MLEAIESFVYSGRIADLILVAMAIEVLAVTFYLRRRNQGLGVIAYVASVVSGASLVLALRAALTGAGGLFVAMYLFAALLAHVAEMAIRILMAGYGSGQQTTDVSDRP